MLREQTRLVCSENWIQIYGQDERGNVQNVENGKIFSSQAILNRLGNLSARKCGNHEFTHIKPMKIRFCCHILHKYQRVYVIVNCSPCVIIVVATDNCRRHCLWTVLETCLMMEIYCIHKCYYIPGCKHMKCKVNMTYILKWQPFQNIPQSAAGLAVAVQVEN